MITLILIFINLILLGYWLKDNTNMFKIDNEDDDRWVD